jgi:hypothetical protein
LEDCIERKYDMSAHVLNGRDAFVHRWWFNGRRYWHSEAYNLICWKDTDDHIWAVDQTQCVHKPDYSIILPGTTGFPEEAHMGMYYDDGWRDYSAYQDSHITWTVATVPYYSDGKDYDRPWEPNYELQMKYFKEKDTRRAHRATLEHSISQAVNGAPAATGQGDAVDQAAQAQDARPPRRANPAAIRLDDISEHDGDPALESHVLAANVIQRASRRYIDSDRIKRLVQASESHVSATGTDAPIKSGTGMT